MSIKTCPLMLTNVYHYDVRRCNYEILKSIGYNISHIDPSDKLHRNIQIGLLQRDNKLLGSYLIYETKKLINYYTKKCKLDDDDIIVVQRDGLYTTKKIENLNHSIPFDLRYKISRFIISKNRRTFMFIKENGEVVVKGVSNKPLDTSFYQLFSSIDYTSPTTIVDSLNKIRKVVFLSNNKKWFLFKTKTGFDIPTEYGMFNLSNEKSIDYIDDETIERVYLWNNYVWPFVEPILLTYIK
jgi:hypothetical protein